MWYAVQVRAGHEGAALDKVVRFVDGPLLKEAFVPQREMMRHVRGEWVTTRETLFPGYLIAVARDPEALSAELAKVPEFTRLLGSEEAFVPLSPREVATIQGLVGDARVVEMSEGIIEGDEVRVLHGPLRDREAIIRKVDRHKRAAYVEVYMLGRPVLVKLGLEIVRKL